MARWRATCSASTGTSTSPPGRTPGSSEIEVQDSAAPFHDWNERVAAECYGPNGAARIKSPTDRIVDIVNNYRSPLLQLRPHAARLARAPPPRRVRARPRGRRRPAWRARGHGNAHRPGLQPRHPARSARRATCARRSAGAWPTSGGGSGARRRASGSPRRRPTRPTPGGAGRGGRPLHHPLAVPGAPGARAGRRLGGRGRRPLRSRPGPTAWPPVGHAMAVFFYDGHIARELAFGEGLASAGRSSPGCRAASTTGAATPSC